MAVVLNRQALEKLQGPNADPKKLEGQIADIEDIVKSAAGFDEKRGDLVHVTVVDFAPEDATLEPLSGPSFMEILKGNLGTIINALALIGTAIVVLMLGVKPVLRFMAEIGREPPVVPEQQMLGAANGVPSLGSDPSLGLPGSAEFANFGDSGRIDPNDPRDRLNRVVGGDVNRAAQVLKQWLSTNADEAA